MEFKILSPQDGNLVQDISWNNEELKAEISAKMEDYKGLVFTEETVKEAKKDRASLNKLRSAFEDERKRIKKLYMDPYNRFEQQVKEVIALIDEPIRLIDAQIKEVEENKKIQKRKDIEELFESIGFQNFVSLNQIWDEKWLNASVPITKIEEQMKSEMYRIGNEVATISRLPEFSFEAMEVYKKSLDMNHAIQETYCDKSLVRYHSFPIKDSDRGPAFKLVEADGGLWKKEAMNRIKHYLEYELSVEIEKHNITIIA